MLLSLELAVKMSQLVFGKEKSFKYYLDLPEELRKPIIDEMDGVARCIFSGTSKLCYKEAKACKNLIYKLAIEEISNRIRISVIPSENSSKFLNIEFYNTPSSKCVKVFSGMYYMKDEVPKDQTKYDDSVDMVEYSAEHFKNLVKFYRKSIRNLRITGEVFSEKLGDCDFGIEDLENLEEVTIYSTYIEHVLPRLPHPLKKLKIHGKTSNEKSAANHEQIYQVKDNLISRYTSFNYDQLTRLSATHAEISIGQLSVTSIYNFILGWQNGTLAQHVERYEWFNLRHSHFEFDELCERFRAVTRPSFNLTHSKEPKKIANVIYYQSNGRLIFQMDDGMLEEVRRIV